MGKVYTKIMHDNTRQCFVYKGSVNGSVIDSTSLVLYIGWRNNRLWRLKLGMKICTEKWGPFPTKKNLAEFISTSIKRILHMVVKIRVSKWTLTESESTEAVQLVHEEVSCRTPYKPIRTTAINCYATIKQCNSSLWVCYGWDSSNKRTTTLSDRSRLWELQHTLMFCVPWQAMKPEVRAVMKSQLIGQWITWVKTVHLD